MHIDIRALLEEAPNCFRVSAVNGLMQGRPTVGCVYIHIRSRLQQNIQDIPAPFFDGLLKRGQAFFRSRVDRSSLAQQMADEAGMTVSGSVVEGGEPGFILSANIGATFEEAFHRFQIARFGTCKERGEALGLTRPDKALEAE